MVVSIILITVTLLVLDTRARAESRFVRLLHAQRGVQLTGSGHEMGAIRASEASDRDIDRLAWRMPSKPSSQTLLLPLFRWLA